MSTTGRIDHHANFVATLEGNHTVKTLYKPVVRLACTIFLAATLGLVVCGSAFGSGPAPAWTITSLGSPSHFAVGGKDFYSVHVTNTGGVASSGSPITITDSLAPGLRLNPAGYNDDKFDAYLHKNSYEGDEGTTCVSGPPAACTIVHASVRPGEAVWMIVPVTVEAGASGVLVNRVSVSGGGAPSASTIEQTPISEEPSPFAYQSLTSVIGDSAGNGDTQAGSHPYRLQLGFQVQTNASTTHNAPGGALRTVRTVLPAGLVINPNATPVRCTETQLNESTCPAASAVGLVGITEGLIQTYANNNGTSALYNMVPPPGVPAELAFNAAGLNVPVHLMGGVDAEDDYALTGTVNEITAYGSGSGAMVELWGNPSDPSHDGVRGNCVSINFDNSAQVPETCPVEPSNVPFITMPSACSGPLTTGFSTESWQPDAPISETVTTTDPTGNATSVDGCGKLEFHPTLQAKPSNSQADSPTGLKVSLHVPQNNQTSPIEGEYPAGNELQQLEISEAGEFALSFRGQSTSFLPYTATAAEVQDKLEGLSTIGAGNVVVEGPLKEGGVLRFTIEFTGALGKRGKESVPLLGDEGGSGAEGFVSRLIEGHAAGERGVLGTEGALASATVRDVSVTLPEGLVVDPSAADGQGACSEAQIGLVGMREGRPVFNGNAPSCPDDAKLGSVSLVTPLLDHPLPGSIYLASQGANPFGSLLALYIVIDDPISGVIVKLAGEVHADPVTGRLTASFKQNPQLPFEELLTEFYGGSRAALTTPFACGTYTTTSDLTPWSAPEGADAFPSSLFTIDTGANGTGCVGSEAQAPNKPVFEAGTTLPVAGGFSPFVLKLSREDGSQRLEGLNVTLPLGLTGKITGVEQCSEAALQTAASRTGEGQGGLEVSSPSCPAGSQIGTVHVGAGSGSPLFVTGHAYLAGPYEGAPFSIAIVTPAVAGPFDLGSVLVRAGLYIDPQSAQVTVKSDRFPTILHGIPLDIRQIDVDMDRSDFTLNPTSCNPSQISATETSTTGAPASLTDRFQVSQCSKLAFKPGFTVSTAGKTSRTHGASLHVKLSFPNGSLGNQANIAKVHVQLPKALPSRLSTLNHACIARVFEQNPAACPPESRVGYAKATTPILPVPVEGPAYFVSHGGQKFPELILVLQGDNVTIHLNGETLISKNITTSTFNQTPDVPVSSFELNLPQGKYSALAANRNLCATTLTMPTRFTAQNGAVLEQNTPIETTGCPYTLQILKQTIHNHTATLTVLVPQAGKLTATGPGLTQTTKTATRRQTITLTLKQHTTTNVQLRFTPSKGKQRKILHKTVTVAFH